jgi:hypothetical protein
MTPVAFWPRFAVALPTLKLARSWASASPLKRRMARVEVIIARFILNLQSKPADHTPPAEFGESIAKHDALQRVC